MGAPKRLNGRFFRKSEAVNAATKQQVESAIRRRLRPSECRDYARKRMAEALPEIIESLVVEAKKGSIAHTKTLVALGGFDQLEVLIDRDLKREPPRESLTEMLLREIKENRVADPL